MLPTLKVYEIDYSWIISNYLDKELWDKKWNLFIFKDDVFTLNLYNIDVKNKEIRFEVRHNKQAWNYEYVNYPLSGVMSIDILKRQINGAIWNLIDDYDTKLIRDSDGYESIQNSKYDEEEFLKSVAKKFLDDNNVTNEDIREVYIDDYVSKNSTIGSKQDGYVTMCKYTFATEIMLVFTKITKDEARFKRVMDAQKNNYRINKILDEVKEYIKDLDIDDKDLFEDYYILCEGI